MCTPIFLLGVVVVVVVVVGWGFESPTKFSNREGWRDCSFERGFLGKRGVTFFRGYCRFFIKNKLKSEIFNDKRNLKQNVCLCHIFSHIFCHFFSVFFLSYFFSEFKLRIFKMGWDRVKDEKFWYYGDSFEKSNF